MIIVRESSEVARQAGFAEYDHVIQALPPNRAHHLHLRHKVRPEDAIAIAQQIAWCRLPGEGFAQLLGSPFRSRVSGDAKMQNAPPVVRPAPGTRREPGTGWSAP